MDTAPLMTVVIPAYNEGPMAEKSITSVANAQYPRDRLDIIVVDDGSRDDTWVYIQRAAQRYEGFVKTLHFEQNRGKRAALEAAIRLARGQIIVTINSDSVIDEHTLLAIAGPFQNPRIGAVAGQVNVYNRRQGLIPRMLHVRYTLSFDFLRAVQSTYGTVYCCPGALAAYRASVVHEVLEEWVGQSFLGAQCTYGEDRAMTNFLLSRGYDTVYQRTAVVHTITPWKYNQLCKMFLRWDRSYIREEIRLASIVWKRLLLPRIITVVDIAINNLRYPVGYVTLAVLIYVSRSEPEALLRLAMVIAMMSVLGILFFLGSERSWNALYGMLYGYYAVFALSWIFPYALLTLRQRAWLTR